MIVRKKKNSKIVIDLTGPDGNAFVLLGLAKRLCAQFELEYDTVRNEMTSGDYENLVQILEKYFGSVIIMER